MRENIINIFTKKDVSMINLVVAVMILFASSEMSARILEGAAPQALPVSQLPEVPQTPVKPPKPSTPKPAKPEVPAAQSLADVVTQEVAPAPKPATKNRCIYCDERGINCTRDANGGCIPCQAIQQSIKDAAAAALALVDKVVTFDVEPILQGCGCGKPKGTRCDSCAEALLKKSLQDALVAALAEAAIFGCRAGHGGNAGRRRPLRCALGIQACRADRTQAWQHHPRHAAAAEGGQYGKFGHRDR